MHLMCAQWLCKSTSARSWTLRCCCRDGTIDYEEFAAMMRQTDQELVTAASFFREREFAVST